MWRIGSALAVVAVALAAGCGGSPGGGDDDRPTPAERASTAQRVLDDLGALPSGEYAGGSFDFSTPIDDGRGGGGDRIASTSWDVYYVLDAGGGNGSWGAGLDVFAGAEEALRTTEAEAGFFCPGPRQEVSGLDLEVGQVWAYSCERPAAGGFHATLDAVEGSAAANLTVTGGTRATAEAALAAVAPVLVDALVAVSSHLDDGS